MFPKSLFYFFLKNFGMRRFKNRTVSTIILYNLKTVGIQRKMFLNLKTVRIQRKMEMKKKPNTPPHFAIRVI